MSYTPSDVIQDAEVFRELQRIAQEFEELPRMKVLTREPYRPREGNFCVCDGVNWNPFGDGVKRAIWYNGMIGKPLRILVFNMYQVIHPLNIDQVWHLVAPWIAQAIGESDTWMDLDIIKETAKGGNTKIWIGRNAEEVIDMVLVTENWLVGGKSTLVLRWLCGRNMEEWFGDLAVLENWAANNGYQAIHIWGRPGWKKVCKPLGYNHEVTIISKPLIRGLH